ncbi:hypothetical protein Tco_0465123 [Tanacetum coccineum]
MSVDKNAQGIKRLDKRNQLEKAMKSYPLDTNLMGVVNWIDIFSKVKEVFIKIMRANGADTPEDAYDRVLWSDLRTMFDPPLNEDAI